MGSKLFTSFGSNGRGHVHVDDITKQQLAQTVNEQAARLTQQDQWIKAIGRVLITIVTVPHAVRYEENGALVVAASALADVVAGTQLKLEQGDGLLRLTVHAPATDLPGPARIVVPGGGL